jgi:hypothetical protein
MNPPTMLFNEGDDVYLKMDISFDKDGKALALAWQGLEMFVPSEAVTLHAGAKGQVVSMSDRLIQIFLEDTTGKNRLLHCKRWMPLYFSRVPVARVDKRPTAWARVLVELYL